jgi:hypothetical protein
VGQRSSAVGGGLEMEQLSAGAAQGEERFVRAVLLGTAIFENEDPVGQAHRGADDIFLVQVVGKRVRRVGGMEK